MWVFGYGSLIWKVDFPVARAVPGYITGFVRRFYQSSSDHRGTPEHPGRVVTLIPLADWQDTSDEFPADPEGRVYGVAYQVPEDKVEEVKKHLDYREKNGYSLHKVSVHGTDSDQKQITIHGVDVYIGTSDNEAYVGPEPLDQLARHIAHSHGANSEYLFQLHRAIEDRFSTVAQAADPYLAALDREVHRILDADPPTSAST